MNSLISPSRRNGRQPGKGAMPGSRIGLRDLIDVGLLRADEELECRPHKDESYTGRLNADGTIAFDGLTLADPSPWPNRVTGYSTRNGWTEVYARGQRLDVFRKKYEYWEREAESAREFLRAKGHSDAEVTEVLKMAIEKERA